MVENHFVHWRVVPNGNVPGRWQANEMGSDSNRGTTHPACAPVIKTWGRRGQTPGIPPSFTWKRMSAVAGVSRWRFCFRFFDGAVDSDLAEAGDFARQRLKSMQRRPSLIRAFWQQAELAL